MHKKKLPFGLLLALSTGVFAGTMGPVSTAEPFHPFIGIEGGYTINQVKTGQICVSNVTNVANTAEASTNTKNGGTVRGSVGLVKAVSELFSMTGEIGWGYYGENKVSFVNDSISSRSTQSGFDILAGLVYNQPKYDLFFKGGALIANSSGNFYFNSRSTSFLADKPTGTTILQGNLNSTQALPELKLGGSYLLFQKLALTASWSHAFGYNNRLIISESGSSLGNDVTITGNLQNPTLDIFMLGLQYTFG